MSVARLFIFNNWSFISRYKKFPTKSPVNLQGGGIYLNRRAELKKLNAAIPKIQMPTETKEENTAA